MYFLTTTAGQFFALSATLLLLGFVARLVFALAWRLFVGFMFVLIIILLII
ncbi:putative membrane protein [Bacteroides fragilis str. 1007-1-F |nr:putative membrane protein [Bacteroides fragilis str. 1007-1-F \